jgi:hypothetical protein
MAQVTLTIPDAVDARVLDGFAASYGYTGEYPPESGAAETKAGFLKRKLVEFILSGVSDHEANLAASQAAAQARAKAGDEIILS